MILAPNKILDGVFDIAEKGFEEGKKIIATKQFHGMEVNTGFMLLKPNISIFNELFTFWETKYFQTVRARIHTDQSLLNAFFDVKSRLYLDYGYSANEWYLGKYKKEYFWNGTGDAPPKLFAIHEKKTMIPQESLRKHIQNRWEIARKKMRNGGCKCRQMMKSKLRHEMKPKRS